MTYEDGRGNGGRQLCPGSLTTVAHCRPSERLDAWQALFRGAHAIEVDSPRDFDGSLRATVIDRIMLHRMDASSQAVSRTPDMIRRDGMDHFVLHMRADPTFVRTEQGDLHIPGGAITVNDLSKPYWADAVADRNSITIVLARELVTSVVRDTSDLHGVVFNEGAGHLIRAHLTALAQSVDVLTQDAAPAVAQATVEIFAACLSSTVDRAGRAYVPLQAATLLRARRYIDAQLSDPNLAPEAIAQAVGVSRTTLFRLFEPWNGVSSYILDRRLSLIHRDLVLRRVPDTIAQVGYRHGFRSDVQLSRAFRRKFGVSPSDARRATAVDEQRTVGSGGSLIGDWLKTYG